MVTDGLTDRQTLLSIELLSQLTMNKALLHTIVYFCTTTVGDS